MIELTFAIADKAGQKFMVRASSICMVESATGGAGALIWVGNTKIAVLETTEWLRRKLSSEL